MFTDKVKLKLMAEKGGNGLVSWRREKYVPRGGPTGGNGGKGSSVIFKATVHEISLESLRNIRVVKSENGQQGGPNQRQGRSGRDRIISVPCGTLVKDSETGHVLFDLSENDQEWMACKGGGGGRGNASFKSSKNRAPNFATDGKAGQSLDVELELKLIADVGLVGFPNAGKSTLISAVSAAKVKIASYPFTTLRPNLAYVDFSDFSRILIADIPGIIKDAHADKGLGFEFLRHIERTKILVFVLDVSGIDGRHPIDDYEVLRHELAEYNEALLEKPILTLLNKVDTEGSQEKVREFREKYELSSERLLEVSALEKQGLHYFLEQLHALMKAEDALIYV